MRFFYTYVITSYSIHYTKLYDTDTKSAFMLLTKIQDEVHRFAISYMKSVHNKKTYEIELVKIRGIGIKKAQKLMMHYKTREAIKNATAENLAAIAGVNQETAKELFDFIQSEM